MGAALTGKVIIRATASPRVWESISMTTEVKIKGTATVPACVRSRKEGRRAFGMAVKIAIRITTGATARPRTTKVAIRLSATNIVSKEHFAIKAAAIVSVPKG